MAIVRFLPADDTRLLATIDAIANGLRDDHGLIYRYRGDDGLGGPEGTFLLCTFWLAQAYAVTGQVERARETLAQGAGYATDLGLLAEQVDPDTGELLGNFPQAFSHLGLVTAAQALADAENGAAANPG
jgi:alpha,alpha-trehalase